SLRQPALPSYREILSSRGDFPRHRPLSQPVPKAPPAVQTSAPKKRHRAASEGNSFQYYENPKRLLPSPNSQLLVPPTVSVKATCANFCSDRQAGQTNAQTHAGGN